MFEETRDMIAGYEHYRLTDVSRQQNIALAELDAAEAQLTAVKALRDAVFAFKYQVDHGFPDQSVQEVLWKALAAYDDAVSKGGDTE